MFTNLQLEEMKTEYKQLLSSVQRPGIENLIEWLDKCDFYEAPSSTKYHNNCKGGLLAHSLNVYKAAVKIRDNMKDIALPEKNIGSISDETLIVAALLHDLCKINYYVPAIKTWKDENAPYGNQWKKYIAYDINDTFPLGHGEKSVLIAQQFIHLTGEEILAIRWHMGFTDPGTFLSFYEKPAFMKAINDVPLVMVIAQADCFASFLMETEYNLKTNEIV